MSTPAAAIAIVQQKDGNDRSVKPVFGARRAAAALLRGGANAAGLDEIQRSKHIIDAAATGDANRLTVEILNEQSYSEATARKLLSATKNDALVLAANKGHTACVCRSAYAH
eukprot:SAG31_NODE_2324_length_5941_cov_1.960801_4_plen_112_part_00